MKKINTTSVAGQFTLIEKHEITGGINKGNFWETKTIVFQNKDLASLCGALQANGNTVFVGLNEHEVDGRKYFSPMFNVFD